MCVQNARYKTQEVSCIADDQQVSAGILQPNVSVDRGKEGRTKPTFPYENVAHKPILQNTISPLNLFNSLHSPYARRKPRHFRHPQPRRSQLLAPHRRPAARPYLQARRCHRPQRRSPPTRLDQSRQIKYHQTSRSTVNGSTATQPQTTESRDDESASTSQKWQPIPQSAMYATSVTRTACPGARTAVGKSVASV